VNRTPHAIRILRANGTPLRDLPPTDVPARCREIRHAAGTLTLDSATARDDGKMSIPLVRVGFADVTGLPEPTPGTWHLAPGTWHLAPGTWHIVSRLVADSLPHRTDLLVPHDVTRDADSQITGCRSLALGASLRPDEEP
jgi:hypothetical protein